MKMTRTLREEESRLFKEDPNRFEKEEIIRVSRYIEKHFPHKKYNICLGDVSISEREVSADFDMKSSDSLTELFDLLGRNTSYRKVGEAFWGTVPEEDTKEVLAESGPDESTGGYRVTAYLPGAIEDEIDITIRDCTLTLSTSKYTKEFFVQKGLYEMRKTFKNGVLDIRLS